MKPRYQRFPWILLLTLAVQAMSACNTPPKGAQRTLRLPGTPRALAAETSATNSWIGVGVDRIDPEPDRGSLDVGTGLSVSGGTILTDNALGPLGVELRLGISSHDAVFLVQNPSNPFLTTFEVEEPTNLQAGLGILQRMSVAGAWSALLRTGLLYQYLYDSEIDDSGFGYFLGTGIERELGGQWSMAVEIGHSSTGLDRFDVDQLTYGIALRRSF